MTTRLLITSDIHLTTHPLDEYRWDVLAYLHELAVARGVAGVLILGDLTEKKDAHPSSLVNRLFDILEAFPVPVWILRGNHDYDVNPNLPFFKFLPNFITKPCLVTIGDLRCFFIPHHRREQDLAEVTVPKCEFLFLHQTFKGAVAENGQRLDGIDPLEFDGVAKKAVISGDIHVPQRLGPIIYSGAPHPIRFGDTFEPRVLYWDGAKLKSIRRDTIRKATLTVRSLADIEKADLDEGDQLKIKYRLARRDFPEWSARREAVFEWCERAGVVLQGCAMEEDPATKRVVPRDVGAESTGTDARTHEELFDEFCDEKRIDREYVRSGRALVRAAR